MSTTSPVGTTLRRRLFGSHLLVIAVALGVMLVGIGIVLALFEVFRGHGGINRGQDGGPFGLLFGLMAASLASAFVSWRVTKRLAEPLEQIGAATKDLAAGRYDVRVPGADTAELNALAEAVNQLAADLKTTEQRRLRLIGDVAHELRNPLSTIEGTMEALLDGVVDPEPDTFARIGREAARLRRLSDDLSSLSTAGELTVHTTDRIDVVDLTTSVVAHLVPQATAKGLELALECSEVSKGASVVLGDRDRLTQVLTNVIGNAVQYTDTGAVNVKISSADNTVIVEVSDSGRGLAADELRLVFERFYRVDRHYADGTGVGLAIAKLIVEAHGGQITSRSDGLGMGSTFATRLPSADRSDPPASN